MARIEIVYFSGSGHTALQAEAVGSGAAARLWRLPETGEMPEGLWPALQEADAVIFGSPTLMGGPAWQFKKFADETGEIWYNRLWQDKVAGGFTTSGSTVGDKGEAMGYFITLANQHGMIWTSLGQVSPPSAAETPQSRNWIGANGGAMAVSRGSAARPDLSEGDLISAREYGARIRMLTERLG